MRTILYTTIALLLTTISHAQENFFQVDQGKNYNQSVFLDLATKEVTTVDFTTWDIAFATGARDVSVLINEAVQGGEAGRSLHLFSTSSKDFSETDMTHIKDTLFNGDDALGAGAFNTIKDETNPFDFGWGLYNPSTHIVSGTQVFILQLRNGDYKKIRIDHYNTQKYTFTYADLNGENKITDSIAVTDYTGKSLAYYSIKDQKALDLEPDDWDLKFTRYNTPAEDTPGKFLNYQVLGVFSKPGIEVAKAANIDPKSVEYEAYADSLSKAQDAIGYDWKYFDRSTFQYSILDDLVYFVKTLNNEVYKIQFVDFEGASTGITTIKVTLEEVLSAVTTTPEYIKSTQLFPNPVSGGQANIQFTSEKFKRNVTLRVCNSRGQEIHSQYVDVLQGENRFSLPSLSVPGLYYVVLRTDDGITTLPLINQ